MTDLNSNTAIRKSRGPTKEVRTSDENRPFALRSRDLATLCPMRSLLRSASLLALAVTAGCGSSSSSNGAAPSADAGPPLACPDGFAADDANVGCVDVTPADDCPAGTRATLGSTDCKPVAAKTMMARLVSVIEYPRPFVRTDVYFGPCRRRRANEEYKGPERRTMTQQAAE